MTLMYSIFRENENQMKAYKIAFSAIALWFLTIAVFVWFFVQGNKYRCL